MSWTHQANRGTANSKTASATISVDVSAAISAGQIVIVTVATDNQSTTGGNTTVLSVADDQSNTYTRLVEYTQTGGSVGDGRIPPGGSQSGPDRGHHR